jgi:hypothetical protein
MKTPAYIGVALGVVALILVAIHGSRDAGYAGPEAP